MRGLDRHRFAGVLLPLRSEGGVEILIQFARRIVGYVEKRLVRECGSDSTRWQTLPASAAAAKSRVILIDCMETSFVDGGNSTKLVV